MKIHFKIYRAVAMSVVASCALASHGLGASFYVDATNGNDKGDGGEAAPFRTLTHAVAKAQPGDTVVLVPGQSPIREGVQLQNRSGKPGAPIIIDGRGNTLTGSAPIDPLTWEEVRPGLYRHIMTLFNDKSGKMTSSLLARYFFVVDGSIHRMGRRSKNGPGAQFKTVEELQPGEWTFVTKENAFYIATPPGQKLADAQIEAPIHLNGFATSGSVAHFVVRNLHVRHFLNDGFNFHGHSRDVLIENCSATECGDDGMSAHGNCHVTVRGFTARRNSTGICHINASVSTNENVLLLDNVSFNLYLLGSGTHTFSNLRSNAASIRIGKAGDTLQVSFVDFNDANGNRAFAEADVKVAEGVKVHFTGARRELARKSIEEFEQLENGDASPSGK